MSGCVERGRGCGKGGELKIIGDVERLAQKRGRRGVVVE